MQLNSKMHLGPTFDAQRYQQLDEEVQRNFIEDNKRTKGRRLGSRKFSFRATAKKIASVGKSFISRITKQRTPHQESNSTDISHQSVKTQVISTAVVLSTADDSDGKLQDDRIPVEKGHVHRMVLRLEPHFKGAKVPENRGFAQRTHFAGNQTTVQADPPSPARAQHWDSFETKLVPQSSKKLLGVSAASTPYAKVKEEKHPNSQITPPPSSQAATGTEEGTGLCSDHDRGENNSHTQCMERRSHCRYFHQLQEMEKMPRMEQGLVEKLALQIEQRVLGLPLTNHIRGPPLQLKSSSVTSSFKGKKEDNEKAIRIQNRRRRMIQKKELRAMKAAKVPQVHYGDQGTTSETHSPDKDINGSPSEEHQANVDYVAIRLRRRRERILKLLEAYSQN